MQIRNNTHIHVLYALLFRNTRHNWIKGKIFTLKLFALALVLSDGGLGWCCFVLQPLKQHITMLVQHQMAHLQQGWMTTRCSCFHVPVQSGCDLSLWQSAGTLRILSNGRNSHSPTTEPWQFTAHSRHTEQTKALICGDIANTDWTRWKSRLIRCRTEMCLLCRTHKGTFFKKCQFTKSRSTFFTHSPMVTKNLDNPRGVRQGKGIHTAHYSTDKWPIQSVCIMFSTSRLQTMPAAQLGCT